MRGRERKTAIQKEIETGNGTGLIEIDRPRRTYRKSRQMERWR